jgi:hypothetical protein
MYDELFDISNLSSENIENCIRIFIKNSIQKSLLESDSNSVLSFSHQFNDFNWVQASRLGVAHRENKFLSLADKDFIDFKSVISEIGDTPIFDEFEDSHIVLVDIDFEINELVSYKDINLYIVSRATVFKVLSNTLPMGNKNPAMHSNKLN